MEKGATVKSPKDIRTGARPHFVDPPDRKRLRRPAAVADSMLNSKSFIIRAVAQPG
jgi:hypothetical protein